MWKGKIDIFKGKTFFKYLIERLKENIKNDIKTKFNEKNINIEPEISNEIREILNKPFFKNNIKIDEKKDRKDIEKIEKYLTFAKSNIKSSDLP